MFHAHIFIHRHVEATHFCCCIYACVYNHDPCHCHAAVIFQRTVDVVLKLASTTVVFCSNAIIYHGVSRKSGTAMAIVAVAVPTTLSILFMCIVLLVFVILYCLCIRMFKNFGFQVGPLLRMIVDGRY